MSSKFVVESSRQRKATSPDSESVRDFNFDPSVHSALSIAQKQTRLDEYTSILKDEGGKNTTKNEENYYEKIAATSVKKYNQSNNSIKASVIANKPAMILGMVFGVMIGIIIILLIVVVIRFEALEFSELSEDLHTLILNNMTREGNFSCKELEQNQRNLFQQVLSNISSLLKNETELLLDANISSCAELLTFIPSSSSGYYTFRSSTGQLVSVYCDMTRTCGNITGGWMRVAQLDVYDCPSGLMSELVNGTKTCIKMEAAAGCTPIHYSSFNISYSKVCGKILGFGLGTLDGFIDVYGHRRGSSVMDDYLDGISFTVNGSHVWSLAAGMCNFCDRRPNFIHHDFTCTNISCDARNVCPGFLWHSNDCGRQTPFFKNFSVSTTADLRMKICRDEERENEDIAISSIELYVQ